MEKRKEREGKRTMMELWREKVRQQQQSVVGSLAHLSLSSSRMTQQTSLLSLFAHHSVLFCSVLFFLFFFFGHHLLFFFFYSSFNGILSGRGRGRKPEKRCRLLLCKTTSLSDSLLKTRLFLFTYIDWYLCIQADASDCRSNTVGG